MKRAWGTFTACGSALSAALRDDEQAVYDAYFTAMKMAAFALERADAGRDGDFAARWGDVLRACTSRTYAERWSAKIMERFALRKWGVERCERVRGGRRGCAHARALRVG